MRTITKDNFAPSIVMIIGIAIKKAVVVINDCETKESDVWLNVMITSSSGNISGEKIKVKKGISSVDIIKELKQGDRLLIALEYTGKVPRGIWIAMRGEQG